jgi:hypothetical protein
VAITCKKFLLVEVETFRYLNKYLFRERKYKNVLERDTSIYIYIYIYIYML